MELVKSNTLITSEHRDWAKYLIGTNEMNHRVDPLMIRVVTTDIVGQGEQILSMEQRTCAIAGVNGGAFDDPNWDGNGFKPAGIVMSGGKLLYHDGGMEDPVMLSGSTKMV